MKVKKILIKKSMTTIILDPTQERKPTPIKLCYYLDSAFEVRNVVVLPVSDFEFVELIARNYCRNKVKGEPDLDLIFLYNDSQKRNMGVLCAGHWNDGIA